MLYFLAARRKPPGLARWPKSIHAQPAFPMQPSTDILGFITDQSAVRRIVIVLPLCGGGKPSVINMFTECKKRGFSTFLSQLHPHQHDPSFADYIALKSVPNASRTVILFGV